MDDPARPPAGEATFLLGGGEMGALMRTQDWTTSSLGPPSTWPQSLRSAVSICLNSQAVSAIYWGPDFYLLYNDAYRPFLDGRHPWALGRSMSEVWPTPWQALTEPARRVRETGKGVVVDSQRLLMERDGGLVESFWYYSLAPIRGDASQVAGIFLTALDTTERVLAERRQAFLLRLADALRPVEDAIEAQVIASRLLGQHLGASRVAYAEDGGDGETVILTRNYTDRVPSIEGRYRYADYGEDLISAMRTGRAMVRSDIASDPALSSAEKEAHAVLQLGATLNVPLVKGGRLLAILAVHYPAAHAFTSEEVALAQEVAERTWAAVERARAEAGLRQSAERFRAIVETATDYAIFTTDPEGRVVTWAPGAEEVLGWTAAEAVGQPMDMTYTSEDQAAGVPEAERRQAQEVGQAPDVRWHQRHDGSRVFIEGLVRPLTGPDGTVTGFVKVGQDVTERRAIADALRESEARFRNMADHAPVMMWVTDAGGACTYLNRAWYEFTGQTPEGAQGFGWLDATHLDDRPETERVFVDANAKGDPFRLEYRLRHHDGGYRWVIDAASPRFGAEGEFLGYIGSVTDIHERKEAEQILERRVAEAMADREAAQEQLRQSQKMEAMGSLTGGVAHDFNNLLTPIIGSLDRLVTRGVGSERERHLMVGALESAERARTLVQRLLAFARRQPLQPVAVDVGALVGDMAGLIGSTLGPRITMRLELAPDLPPARADANQLEMALLNLAVNARDAMPEGGTLTIAASRESVQGTKPPALGIRPGHYLRLAIADTGIGMDAATLARAAEPFFSTKGIGKGTGLGLSMVHGLAAQLGGELTIDSKPSQGTTVALWLPLSVATIEGAPTERTVPRLGALRGRVLLVDDEDLVRMSTADMLMDLGFDVLEAEAAEDAMRLLQEGEAVDLLVTDHLMPGMSGAELAQAARRLRPGLPVLIVSGYAEVEGIAPDLPRLVKPFRMAELAERMAALMPKAPPAA